MAKPIEAIPAFKGKAAKWLTNYLEGRRPDPAKAARARKHLEEGKRIKLVRE